MLANLVFLLAFLAATAIATPVADSTPAPVAIAAAASSSVAPSQLGYTIWFASKQCEFTDGGGAVTENVCANLDKYDTGTVSYKLDFFRGSDVKGERCEIEYFHNTNCTGKPVTKVKAGNLNTNCTVEDQPTSVKYICS